MLIVQALGLAGLVWYTLETRKMRLASQLQVTISQDLINAAMAQVEGLSKPCLTLWSGLRDGPDTVLEAHGAIGSTKARGDQGTFVVQNIGNGVALNVSYRMTRHEGNHPVNTRYIQNVLASQKVPMTEALQQYTQEVPVEFDYESIGGRRYRSRIDMNHHVLTNLRFTEVNPITAAVKVPGKAVT